MVAAGKPEQIKGLKPAWASSNTWRAIQTSRICIWGTDREYGDNNESCKALRKDLAGFFVDKNTNRFFVAQITRIDGNTLQLDKYSPVFARSNPANHDVSTCYGRLFPNSLYANVQKGQAGNPVLEKLGSVTMSAAQLRLEEVADIQ